MPLKSAPLAEAQREIDSHALGGYNPVEQVVSGLESFPLGRADGDPNLNIPQNSPGRPPDVWIINHSRTKMRRVCVAYVSDSGEGAMEALKRSKQYRDDKLSIELIREEAKRGRDMSVYEDMIKPVVWHTKFDGRDFYVEPAPADSPDNPVPQLVPEGIWDINLGNFDRMNAMTENRGQQVPDTRMRSEEAARLALRFQRGKPNVIWRIVANGKSEERSNPFGYLEFVRQVPKEAPQVIDSSFVTALEIGE